MLVALVFVALQSSALDALLDNPKLAGSLVSCTVADEQGRVLYERNADRRVMPASNMKLLSNTFALAQLGPEFRPETLIWKLSNKTIVKSNGDPMMTHDRLQQAAELLKLNKRLPVYVSQAYRPLVPDSWELDDLPNKYAAPVTAFTVDRGAVEIWSEGEKLSVEPFPYWLRPARGAKTGKRAVLYDPIRRTLSVEGDLPKVRTRLDTLALDQPDAAAGSFLGRGIRQTSDVPTDIPSLVLHGPSIEETIKACLVNSDNNIAENLLLMAALKEGELGKDPYATARERLKKFLVTKVGLEPNDMRPFDGSGMSRHNLVTTRGIVKLLTWNLNQATKDVWLAALATSGAGTLKGRLSGVTFTGKTGTLDMVVALSGYVKTKENTTLTVSVILNNFICGEREARNIADDFINKLADGTVPAPSSVHEARLALSRDHTADVHRGARSRHDGADARERANRGAESAHALLHRAQRVALRVG